MLRGLQRPEEDATHTSDSGGVGLEAAAAAEAGEAAAEAAVAEDEEEEEEVVAIVDPPRTGLKPSVCAALRAQPRVRRVLFVSCNPHGHNMRFDYTVKGGSLIDNAVVRVFTFQHKMAACLLSTACLFAAQKKKVLEADLRKEIQAQEGSSYLKTAPNCLDGTGSLRTGRSRRQQRH